MGELERKSRESTRRTRMQEAVLSTIVSGGRIGGDSLIKHVADTLLGTDFSTTPPRRSEIIRSTASRLSRKGFVEFRNGRYSPTVAGEKLFNDWQKTDYKIKRPRKWDKKWRVIIFDIPEKKRKLRDQAREILMVAGFKRLQDSVWVYPYDCEDVTGLMKVNLGISKYMLYLIVDQIENDHYLRMDFDLIQ